MSDGAEHHLLCQRCAELEAEVERLTAILEAIRGLTGKPYNPRLARIGRLIGDRSEG